MKIEINEVFPIAIEGEGTVMDYVDGEFIFVIKDETWTSFELTALQKNNLQIEFVYKFDIGVFLLTLLDAIDTSDFIFNSHDNEYDTSLFRTFEKGIGFACTLYLLDKDNKVCGTRKVQLSAEMSNVIAQKLKQQNNAPYYEEEFTCNLEGLQNAYEPFELQPLALASESFK